MACKRVATETNGQNSELFDYIYNNVVNGNETLADEYYNYFKSDVFKSEFGDWVADFKEQLDERELDQRLIDDNGEPRLFYDESKALHYYRTRIYTKVYFHNNRGALNGLYTNEAIREITKSLALKFIEPRLNNNFQNINLEEMEGSLSDFITEFVSKKSQELQNEDDFDLQDKGEMLEESLKYKDEWIRHIENFYRELKIVYKEDVEDEMSHDEEVTREGKLYGVSSFERSTKDNVSSNIKLRLSLLKETKVDKNGNIEYVKDNFFNEPKLLSFDEVYSTLLNTLTDNIAIYGEDLFEIYKENLVEISDKKPFILDLLDQLANIHDYEKAELVQAFNLHKNNFIGTTYESKPVKEKGQIVGFTTSVSVQNLSNSGGKNSKVKGDWHRDFLKNFSDERSRFDEKSKKRFTSVVKKFTPFLQVVKRKVSNNEYNSDTISVPINSMLNLLKMIGVETTEKGFNHYLDGLNPMELSFEERVNNFIKLMESTDFLLKSIKLDEAINNNPFDTQAEFNNLAKAEAYYISEGSDASIFTTGKSKWLYSFPSYLSNKVKEWKKDRNVLLHHYNSKPIYESSSYMKWLLALDILNPELQEITSKERLEQFELNVFNSFQEPGQSANAVGTKDISMNDAFADNFNKILGFRRTEVKSNTNSYTRTPTPADKSTEYQFTIPKEMMISVNSVLNNNGSVRVSQEATKVIYEYIRGEYKRILQAKEEIELAGDDLSQLYAHYHLKKNRETGEWEAKDGNALQFQLFPSLNQDKFDSEKLGFELYDENGILNYELLDIADELDLENLEEGSIEAGLVNLINEVLSTEVLRMRDHMFDIKMTDRIDGITINRAFDTEIWDSYLKDENTDIKIAGDIVVNNLISQVEYSKMFSGDVAYYKNMEDYKKRIPATYTDGLQLYLKEGQEQFTVSIIDSVEGASHYIEELARDLNDEDLVKEYSNINVADAQAWITPARWKFLKQGLGHWSALHDSVYSKINGEIKEPLTSEELKIAAQPLKGVYFEINNGVPTFLKYSQAVLIPQILENSPGLAKLANAMTNDNVDELITFDGIKVGSNLPIRSHDENGLVKDNLKLNTLQLKNSGWKLQQNLPTKTFTPTDLGSQLQKNIFEGLSNNLDGIYMVDGQEMTGEEVIEYAHTILNDLSDKGLNSLFNELNIGSDYKIRNTDKLNRSLINELKSRGASQNVIDALEAGLSTYAIPGYQQKVQNIFASMVLDRVIKVKTNGGAFIQMSNYGFSNEKANNKGVIYTPWAEKYNSEPKFLKDEKGNYILSENGKKILKPGGILISGSFIAKYIPDYKKYANNPEKLFGTKENNYRDGIIDSKILQSIIGYRIPNQGLASNDALEIVGILPEEMGDTIVAYTGITKKTGSDFDIDKMYIMMPTIRPLYKHRVKLRDYAYNKLRGNTLQNTIDNIEAITNQIDSEFTFEIDNDRLAKLLLSTSNVEARNYAIDNFVEVVLTSKNELSDYIKESINDYDNVEAIKYNDSAKENELIQVYKSVLTDESNYNSIMTPIDFPFMKNDILDLHPSPEKNDIQDFNVIDDINLKYEFSAGMAGVGITANQLVDHNRGMMADINVSYLNIGQRGVNGRSKLDNKYSEELSDDELKEYDKSINKNKKGNDRIDVSKLKSIPIAHSLSAIMNANVDIANDSYITRGNWTTQTSNVGEMLIRAGVHPFRVNAILGQPVIREYIDFITNSESKIVNETGNMMDKFIEDKIIQQLKNKPSVTFNDKTIDYVDLYNAQKYGDVEKKLSKLFRKKLEPSLVQTIENEIKEVVDLYKNKNSNYNLNKISLTALRRAVKSEDFEIGLQMHIFNEFTEWNDIAKNEVGPNIVASKIDTNGYGKNISSLIIKNNIINNLLAGNSKFKGFETKLNFNGVPTFLSTYIDNGVTEILKVMQSNPSNFMIAQPSVINTFNEISKSINDDILLQDNLADKLEKGFYSYFMSGFPALKTTITDKLRLRDSLPNEVLTKKKENPNNKLLQELRVNIGQDGLSYISMSNRTMSPSFQTELTAAWKDLLKFDNEFATDLIKYSFLTSGLQMSINQFYTYIPFEFFAENNINDYINEVASDLSLSNKLVDNAFIENFFRNNSKDNQITRRVFDNEIITPAEDYDFGYSAGFVMQESGKKPLYVKREGTEVAPDTLRESKYSLLYRLIGYNDSNKAIYVRTSALSTIDNKGNKIVEYSYDKSSEKTIVQSNKALNMKIKLKDGQIYDLRTHFIDMIGKDKNGIPKDEGYFNKPNNETIRDIEEVEEINTLKVDTTASWSNLKNQPVYTEQGVNTMRTSNKESPDAHFGNPFSEGGYSGTIKMPSVKDAIQAYKDWLLGKNISEILGESFSMETVEVISNKENQREWILEQINSGKLDNATLLYDGKLAGRGLGSHANALLEVINEIRNNIKTVNKNSNQLDLFNDNNDPLQKGCK